MRVKEPIFAIVGRPNVGKSTLFNRIVGKKKAVVEDEPGVTRDRNYARVDRYSVPFYLVDTGGFELNPDDDIKKAVVEQTLCAAEEADVVFCLFDAHNGMHPSDSDVMQMLRKGGCSVVYVVNKCDGLEQAAFKSEFYSLGMDELEDISALNGRGVRDVVERTLQRLPNYSRLLDSAKALQGERENKEQEVSSQFDSVMAEVFDAEEEDDEDRDVSAGRTPRDLSQVEFAPVYLPDESYHTPDDYLREYRLAPSIDIPKSIKFDESQSEEEMLPGIDCIKMAIIGRPNVGKSTLLNTILGQKRAITSDIAGTTRDCLDQEIIRDGQRYLIIDTAGLRKKARISDSVEHYSVLRALDAVRDADAAVMLLDATTGPTEQDSKILGLAHDLGKGIVIVVNKWDAVAKDHCSVKKSTDEIRDAFKFCRYAPIVFVSALSGRRCPRVIEVVKDVAIQRMRRVPTGRLNQILKRAHQRFAPPVYRGRSLKLFFASQVGVTPPTFVLFFNYSKSLHFSYMRFLKNALRAELGFEGTDLRLLVRKRGNKK